MSDTFRALCAELVQELERYQDDFPAKTDKMAYRAMAADAVLDRARAALAQPEPVGPTDEKAQELFNAIRVEIHGTHFDKDVVLGYEPVRPGAFARAVLQRWGRPTIAPIPVSERLPGPEDCDAEGRCWMLGKIESDWRLICASNSGVPKLSYCFSHWLPFYALPLPPGDHH